MSAHATFVRPCGELKSSEHDGHDGTTTDTMERPEAVHRVRRVTVVAVVFPALEQPLGRGREAARHADIAEVRLPLLAEAIPGAYYRPPRGRGVIRRAVGALRRPRHPGRRCLRSSAPRRARRTTP